MRFFLFYLSVFCCSVCSNLSLAGVVVSEARIKQVLPSRTTTAAYMNLHNTSIADATLVAVRMPQASSIEMHEIVESGALSGMRRRPVVAVPAGEIVAFKTGGLHLMVFGVQQHLENQVDIELCFDDDTCQIVRFKTEAW